MTGPSPPSHRWLDDVICVRVVRLCAVLALLVALMPPEGIPGVELCPSIRWTQAPCPGCGLTRCGSHLLRGRLAQAMNLNPFGLVFIPGLFALGILAFVPPRWLERIRIWVAPQAAPVRFVCLALVAAFVLFGVLRWFAVFLGWVAFPA